MKKSLFIGLMICLCYSFSEAQEQGQEQKQEQKESKKPMEINTGFYMRLGPVFPLGNYNLGQRYYDQDVHRWIKSDEAKIGATAELGSHFYTGPSFANHYLRVGIDVTYANLWFTPTDEKNVKYWYWYFGQKVGPIITVSIPGGVMFDFGFKLSPVVGYTDNVWGRHVNEEIIMNIKFHLLLCSFQYCLGKMNYTNFTGKGDNDFREIQTFRILLGMKIH